MNLIFLNELNGRSCSNCGISTIKKRKENRYKTTGGSWWWKVISITLLANENTFSKVKKTTSEDGIWKEKGKEKIIKYEQSG